MFCVYNLEVEIVDYSSIKNMRVMFGFE